MKVTVKIDERSFDVEIEDLLARPVIAIIEGERFEVWPQDERPAAKMPETSRPASVAAPVSAGRSEPPPVPAPRSGDTKAVRAPIPGVIISIAVAPGDQVAVGQELCVLEAMKMKNLIRARRAGEIGKVLVAAGEHVQHHDLLFEYAG
jgi:biotin carboxyl carrier protein